jgi:hypothetical protein
MEKVKADIARIRGMLRHSVDLHYEHLFGTFLSLAERLDRFWEIAEYAGYEPVDGAMGEIRRLFSASSKVNDPETYRRIPNIDEIESELGSDEDGWLFK